MHSRSAAAVTTLTALVRLLDDVRNMVVGRSIQDSVYEGVAALVCVGCDAAEVLYVCVYSGNARLAMFYHFVNTVRIDVVC